MGGSLSWAGLAILLVGSCPGKPILSSLLYKQAQPGPLAPPRAEVGWLAKGQDRCVCQPRVMQYAGLELQARPRRGQGSCLLWAQLAASLLGWLMEEIRSGKGILKEDDWLA